MVYHVLNGDAMVGGFPSETLPGELLVMREALVSGDLSGDLLSGFAETRARHHSVSLQEYKTTSASQFEKILNAPPYAEFNLWFEYDLFCQVNYWFVLNLISQRAVPETVFVVYSSFVQPGDENFWSGFGGASAGQLEAAFQKRIKLGKNDLATGADLWKAYRQNDLLELKRMSALQSPAFPFLSEVVDAHIDRFPADGRPGRPERFIRERLSESEDFRKLFLDFRREQSIYGFGDTQVKELYDKVAAGKPGQDS